MRSFGMIACYEKKGNICAGIGLPLLILSVVMMIGGGAWGNIGPLLLVAGIILFWFGCGYYASAKGHSAVIGVALAFLGLIGLLILLALEDKHKQPKAVEAEKSAA
jgi:hypothetical protein